MNFPPLEQINRLAASDNRAANPEALRQAAAQFEAILLNQLTAALNKSGGDGSGDEESLFGNDGGTGLAQQMFSEQLAKTMAEAGGIGLSELIMRRFGVEAKPAAKNGALARTMAAVREIKAGENPASDPVQSKPLINRNARVEPVSAALSIGNADEAELVSTFADEAARDGLDDSLKNLMLDGRLQNSTRPRVVPNAPISFNGSAETLAPLDATKKIEYQMPVAGRISSEFGNRFHPIDKRTKFHGGIDIAVPRGTTVNAAADGVVTFAGWKNGYGNLVVVRHADGRETRYAHLDKLSVAAGDPVAAGKPIALSGSTGKSTGPHLHFELRENGELVNPLKFMSNVLPRSTDK